MSDNSNSSSSTKLPLLRRGIHISFSDYDLEGKPQWMIHDAGRNKFFIIGWVEYELLSRWDLGTAEAIIESVNQETTLHVDMQDIESMVNFLKNNFLFKQSGYQIHESAKEQKIFKNDNPFHWLINYYLFFRIPLFHPDKLLDKTKVIGDFLFSRTTLIVMTLLGIIALYQISMQWETFSHTFSSIFTLQGLFIYLVVFVVTKLFHELGHAYMCKRYGVPVPSLGVAFLVFWPVLYTDTTLSWSLNSKARMRIALAGMWVETYVTIIAALIWCNTHNTTLQAICYVAVAVNWVASVLINVSPFMRFDGYYVFADFLKMPNLQSRAFALTRWQIRRWLFGWQDPPPEKFSSHMHNILVIYSLTTWIYRFVLYAGIAVLVYHFFVKIIGIMLFVVELYYFMLGPFVTEIHTWIKLKEKFSWNVNTIITTSTAAILLLIFITPVKQTITLPATISYSHRFLIAPEEGIIANIPPKPGSLVKAEQPIIIIKSQIIHNDLEKVYLDYMKSIAELRRASVNEKFSHQKNVLLSEINREKAKYDTLYALAQTLTLKVPFDGVIKELASDLKQGNVVMKNELLGDVIQPNELIVEAYVHQIDRHLIQNKLTGYFYPTQLSYSKIPVTVSSIEVLNSNELNCNLSQELKQDKNANVYAETPCFNVSELGGEIATYTTEEGKFVPVDIVYRVLLTTQQPTIINQILRGDVVLKTEAHSYAYRVIYKIKKLLIEQSGF
ncbi:MAG: HlyD family efflux transporter periplasmic adaptor subunit [Gammaproteobacteria bacterium]|nr:HlyD family efflux transporter periplasmic adaptor subunit [Gammaproteobacteria bacterium]